MQAATKRTIVQGRTEARQVKPARRPRDGWRAAFAAVDGLKRLLGQPAWLQGFRVFLASATGEVEVEVQVSLTGAAPRMPQKVDGVSVRTRLVAPGTEPLADCAL